MKYVAVLSTFSADAKIIHINAKIINEDGHARLSVEVYDNGVGMSEEVLRKAQEAFFTTKPASEGTGLGLSIVSDIMKKHDGRIDIESKEGEYTSIKLIFPVGNEV